MHNFGFNLLDNDGKKQINPNLMPLMFFRKITLTIENGGSKEYDLGIPSDVCVVAFKKKHTNDKYRITVTGTIYNKNGNKWFQILRSKYDNRCNGISFTFYFFCNSTSYINKNSNYGIELFDPIGQLIYSSNHLPLKAKRISLPLALEVTQPAPSNIAVLNCIAARADVYLALTSYWECLIVTESSEGKFYYCSIPVKPMKSNRPYFPYGKVRSTYYIFCDDYD